MTEPPRPAVAEQLDLARHPEGGWFRETWRSDVWFSPAGYDGARRSATTVLFALHPGEISRWHVVRSDEIWLWQGGGSLLLRLGGTGGQPGPLTEVRLGPVGEPGSVLQAVVPGNVWQTAEPAGAEPVVVTCVVSPGFDYADFQLLDDGAQRS